jgi:hypothetical protein
VINLEIVSQAFSGFVKTRLPAGVQVIFSAGTFPASSSYTRLSLCFKGFGPSKMKFLRVSLSQREGRFRPLRGEVWVALGLVQIPGALDSGLRGFIPRSPFFIARTKNQS